MSTAIQPVDILSPGGDLNAYIQGVYSIPVLTAAEERVLATDYAATENLDAARQLILAHLRFVVHIARSYSGYGLPLGDLIQEGNVGLMKAVKRFDPAREVRLVSFAVHWIKAEIHEFILRNWRIVRVATTKAQRKLFFNLRSRKKSLGWLSHKEAEAIAEDLGVEVEQVVQMEGRLAAHDSAFDAPLEADDDEAISAPVHYLEDQRNDPAQLLEEADWRNVYEQGLARGLDSLDARSRNILQRRWLAEPKATLHDLAAEYGVSAERIRQIEQNAMRKIRRLLEDAD
ncbi:MAG: RNA polymerase sigma factor RpoH [Cellvibrionales bacterium]|nr:RNA polymerase sigma factor RpoH [Cellvibrionales bacterium]